MKEINYKKIIVDIIEELRWDLFMGHWKINVKFNDTDSETNAYSEKHLAVVAVSHMYSNAIITIYPILIKEYGNNPNMLREVITHELTHCLTEELFNLASNRYATPPEIQTANEKLVQQIARIIRWNHTANKYDDKDYEKNRRKINQVSVEEIQVSKSSDGNRPATRVSNKRTRKTKNDRKIQMRRNKNKKDNNKSMEQRTTSKKERSR
jgi:hypothetical protein